MKKLLLLTALLIFACSSDSDGNSSDSGGNPCVYEPTLETNAVTDITITSATLNGVISIVSENCDEPNNNEQGFVYSTEIQPTLEDIQVNVNGTNISTTIEGLTPNNTYYVRAFLKNSYGEYYGNEISFNTLGVQRGDFIEGGIVFWINPSNPSSGMVISNVDGSVCNWGGNVPGIGHVYFGVGCFFEFGKGDIYTQRIVDAYVGEPLEGAAHNVNQSNHEGYNDWFLPSKLEFLEICSVKHIIDNYIIENGGDELDGYYWSSSEQGDDRANVWRFNNINVDVPCSQSTRYKYPLDNGVGEYDPKWRGIRKFEL